MCAWPNQRTIDDFPLSKNSPPTFLAHAKDDKTAPISFALADRREAQSGLGVAGQMFIVDSGGHGAFHCGMSGEPGTQWPAALLAWLKQIGMWQGDFGTR